MFEIDFLPIEKTGEAGSKSGDAICLRFTETGSAATRTVVIDGGYSHTGDQMVDHIRRYYGSDRIDLVISTHPDQDHINGLGSILDAFTVSELLIHNPHEHCPGANAKDYSNIEVVDALIGLALDNGTTVTEPFADVVRFGGQLRILGPTTEYYEELVAQHLAEVATGRAVARMAESGRGALFGKAADFLDRIVASLPIETLGEDGETGPRNNTSVVALLTADSNRMLFTGDAGIPALHAAWDRYEAFIGSFPDTPLDFFQAPHHGSRRNLSPSLLNRIFGEPGTNPLAPTAFISSAKADPKHPSPRVTNALLRRGLSVFATEGTTLGHLSDGLASRPNWGPAPAIQPLVEDED
jgi:beta-lactamase superfamily II metal-dependent hydrolase